MPCRGTSGFHTPPTYSVDNFVKNRPNNWLKTAPRVAWNRLVKNQAVKNTFKTIAYKRVDLLRLLRRTPAPLAANCGHLAPVGACQACIGCFKNGGNALWRCP